MATARPIFVGGDGTESGVSCRQEPASAPSSWRIATSTMPMAGTCLTITPLCDLPMSMATASSIYAAREVSETTVPWLSSRYDPKRLSDEELVRDSPGSRPERLSRGGAYQLAAGISAPPLWEHEAC